MAKEQIKGIQVNGLDCSLNISSIIGYITSTNGTEYILKVDDSGNLYTEKNEPLPTYPAGQAEAGKLALADGKKGTVFINSFYCGGQEANERSLNYCSHNFVEISNISKNDINLSGLSLQYAISSIDWKVLPLKGVLKAGSTFVIRGAQCSDISSPTTKIVVDKYDMEWRLDSGELIKFDTGRCKFYLALDVNAYGGISPYNNAQSGISSDAMGYLDLVGVNGSQSTDGFETQAYSLMGGLSSSRIFKRYFSLDPVSQATKTIDKRNNVNDWNFVDLSKNDGEVIPSISVYRPMASREGKNLFYDKTKLNPDRPSMITCSFGIQATDNTASSGNGATRCFNWLSRNLDEKFIWTRRQGNTEWTKHTAFLKGDGRSIYTDSYETKDGETICIYDSIIKQYTNNTVLIAYKFIISGLTAGTYEYVAGKQDINGSPKLENCTAIKSFTVKTDSEVDNGFSFLQTTDQQGFNWDEYRIWNAAAKCILKESGSSYNFMINTGDMTQNGNRLNEWLDYFEGEDGCFNNVEEMATIGNNDLSPKDLSTLGNGSDGSKLWLENITLYFTFESDPENLPIWKIITRGGVDMGNYYIPSLYSFNYGFAHFICLNSEIKTLAEQDANAYNFGGYGYFYPKIKEWCENDIEKYSSKVNIAYCHEMPFTILTPSVAQAEVVQSTRGGGTQPDGSWTNANMPSDSEKYWFSEFCQTHKIPLVMGGHKHTQSTSWPLLENVLYNDGARSVTPMHPIIVVNNETLEKWSSSSIPSGATSLVEYNGYKYPNTWFSNGVLKNECKSMVQLCTFEMEDNLSSILSRYEGGVSSLTPVVYAMSQATSYKHTSNKELPSKNIPWLRYYFPTDATPDVEEAGNAKANKNQKFPFFTIWTVTKQKIEGRVRKVYGAFNDSGKFDINYDGQWVKNGKCATTASASGSIGGHESDIFSINGITSMSNSDAQTDTRIIEISVPIE